MARSPRPRRRPPVIVPLLVAVSVGTMTWAGLSFLVGGGVGLPRDVGRSLEWFAARAGAIADRIARPPSPLVEEGAAALAAAAAPAAADPVAESSAPAAAPRGAANEPAEIVAAAPARADGPSSAAISDPAASPLAPLDLSSPRATLRAFRDTIDRLYRNMRGGLTVEKRAENAHFIAQVLTCLDLSEFAPTLATSKGREAATCLKEVFDRIPFPPDAAIPDAAAVKADTLTRYRVPGTEIALVRIETGPRQGDFVFTPGSVTRAEAFFGRVRHLPYRPDAGSPGLYDAYVTVGGSLIPESFIRGLPHWAHAVILGETVWQWCAAILLAAGFALVALLASTLPRIFHPGWARNITSFLLPLVLAAGSVVADWLVTAQVRLTGDTLIAAKLALRLTLYAGAIAAVMAVMGRVTDVLVRARMRRGDGVDAQLLRLAARVCTFVIVAWIGIQAADSLGVPVAPLLAGLGASGLAVALAAQYSIENLIAGVVLFADKPVRIGDECQYGDLRGRVEQIGLRSTRIRGVDHALVTIPNAELAKVQLVNFTRRERIPIRLPVEIRPDVGPAQVRELLTRFRDLLGDHGRLDPDSPRVRLTGQSSEAYTIEVTALALTGDEGESQAIREEILLSILDEIEHRRCGLGGDEDRSPMLRAA